MSIVIATWIALMAAARAVAVAAPPFWEKVHQVSPQAAPISALVAGGGQWTAAGREVLIRGGSAITTQQLPGKTILGLSRTREGVLALGPDELILRFDGKDWVEEHFVPVAAGANAKARYAGVLHSARAFDVDGNARLVAYGPRGVLIRQTDGTWTTPNEKERDRLSRLAQLGPDSERPARCWPDAWRWLSGATERSWFTCHDGRSFVRDGKEAKATGSLPGACRTRVDAVEASGAGLYLLCGGGIWRSSAERWIRVPAPASPRALATTEACLFLADERTIWRNCSK